MGAWFFRREHSALELRKLAREENGRTCQRMLLIANLLDGMDWEEAASAVGLCRAVAYEWHNRYEEEGIPGLRDRRCPGRTPKVSKEVGAALKARLVAGADLERDGVVAFRGVDAQSLLKEHHGLELSLSAVYELLHREKLSWLTPRPRHRKSDTKRQAEFSQLS
jgi:transposase